MHLTVEHEDFLQNVEFAIVRAYRENPSLRDPEVIRALELAVRFYERKKKKLPELQATIAGNTAQVYEGILTICEWRLEGQSGEKVEIEGLEGMGGDVPIVIMIRGLERLVKSANRWFKKDGQRGYLNFVSQFIV